jgi:hypothetical protein
MQRIFVGLLITLLSCASPNYPILSNFSSTTTPPPPDYGRLESWAAHPNKVDAADSVPLKSNLKDEQQFAAVDVFFVHPTTFLGKPKNSFQWNADCNDGELNDKTQLTTILNQATIFNGSCRVYAPYYRQAHLHAFYTDNKKDGEQALDLAYQDVKAAFEYYLQHYNTGRPIVIASHSQGSYHCLKLLKEYFDGTPLQQKLVTAYLAGRAISPGAFTNIHPTEKPDDIGTWSSWNTFTRGFYPKTYELYYAKALSTNPLLWNSSAAFASKELNHGGVGLHFTLVPNLVDAQNHDGILWVNKPYVKGRWLLRKKNWHRADMNFFYMNIRENVALRIDAFLKSDINPH